MVLAKRALAPLPPETNALSGRTRIEVYLIDDGRVFNRPTPRLRARRPQTNKLLVMLGDTRLQTSIDNGLLSRHFDCRAQESAPPTNDIGSAE